MAIYISETDHQAECGSTRSIGLGRGVRLCQDCRERIRPTPVESGVHYPEDRALTDGERKAVVRNNDRKADLRHERWLQDDPREFESLFDDPESITLD